VLAGSRRVILGVSRSERRYHVILEVMTKEEEGTFPEEFPRVWSLGVVTFLIRFVPGSVLPS
jgi:hypothetical protein